MLGGTGSRDPLDDDYEDYYDSDNQDQDGSFPQDHSNCAQNALHCIKYIIFTLYLLTPS